MAASTAYTCEGSCARSSKGTLHDTTIRARTKIIEFLSSSYYTPSQERHCSSLSHPRCRSVDERTHGTRHQTTQCCSIGVIHASQHNEWTICDAGPIFITSRSHLSLDRSLIQLLHLLIKIRRQTSRMCASSRRIRPEREQQREIKQTKLQVKSEHGLQVSGKLE